MNYRKYKKTKEEIENNFRKLEHLKVGKLEEEIKDLQEQVEYQDLWRNEYSNRIDKAIEYIEEQSKFNKGCDIYKICNKDILLEILEGE